MKKLYFIKTNGYNMVVSVDEANNCRYITETEDFPYITEDEPKKQKQKALAFLKSIEDDSSWDDDCTHYQLFDEFQVEIVAEIEREL